VAIATLTLQETQPQTRNAYAWHLEQIATAASLSAAHVAQAAVEAAVQLLGCDAALLLEPGRRPEQVRVAGAASTGAGRPDAGAEWHVGTLAAPLFERPWHTADGWRPPWDALRLRLGAMGLRSWAGTPVPVGSSAPSHTLVVGSRQAGPPCRRMDLIVPLSTSTGHALGACAAPGAPTDELTVRERQRMLAELCFGVSHALGNIFAALVGNLHLLEAEVTEARGCELMQRLTRATSEGTELMQALQDFSELPVRRTMGVLELSEPAVRTAGLARDMCGAWPSLEGVEITADPAPRCPAWGNHDDVTRALIALVFNAVRAVGRRGRIIIATGTERGHSYVSVRDDGPGMFADVARRAPQPFFSTFGPPHQGLGLTIARGIAVAHRGHLTITPAPGGGTVVTIHIARHPPEAMPSHPLILQTSGGISRNDEEATR